jgi:hypothetical protein
MKKIIASSVIVLALVLTGSTSFAQAFDKGNVVVNAGIGGGGWGGAFGVGGSVEYGITDYIGVGGQVDFRFFDYGWGESGVGVPVAARGVYHFGKHFIPVEKLDVYGGAALGFNVGKGYYSGISVLTGGTNKFVGGIFVGGRYYFANNMGAFVEFRGGSNLTPANAGITFKF